MVLDRLNFPRDLSRNLGHHAWSSCQKELYHFKAAVVGGLMKGCQPTLSWWLIEAPRFIKSLAAPSCFLNKASCKIPQWVVFAAFISAP